MTWDIFRKNNNTFPSQYTQVKKKSVRQHHFLPSEFTEHPTENSNAFFPISEAHLLIISHKRRTLHLDQRYGIPDRPLSSRHIAPTARGINYPNKVFHFVASFE
jgi:hypothetical protein